MFSSVTSGLLLSGKTWRLDVMKKMVFAALCFIYTGCSFNVDVKKEQIVKVDMSKYKVIHVGWIDYPAGQYRQFLYNSPGEWREQINHLNISYLMKYFKKKMSDKKFIGPTNTKAIPGGGDLFIKFDYLGYDHTFNYGFAGVDYLKLRVEMFDIRKHRRIYSGILSIASNEPGPGDWSVYGIGGRLEMEIRNLVKFIASKF
jgi:hypothetical protein